MRNAEVADVLEKAADLYESEQIEWCQGSWQKERTRIVNETGESIAAYVQDGEGQLGLPDVKLKVERVISMCASGALARAVGIPVVWAQEIEGFEFRTLGTDERRFLYSLAREAVLKKLRGESTNPFRPGDPYLTNNIPQWNDSKARSKQEVIDVFKETAKDLRNAQ